MTNYFQDYFITLGLAAQTAEWLAVGVAFVLVLLLSILANVIARRIVLKSLSFVVGKTRTQWDDVLLRRKLFARLAHFVPALTIYLLMPLALTGYPGLTGVIIDAVLLYMIVLAVQSVNALLNGAEDIYNTYPISKEIPIKGFIQFVKLVVTLLAVIIIVSILLKKSPVYFLSGLGALTAVIMLIFRDSILGFVAGIQLTANRMIANGDWVAMPKYGADGTVLEVTLTTVKVQNWDKTITTIPTYALISESFKNWRGMEESGGRRIKRAVNIDMNTIRFCDQQMLERFGRIQYIAAYIEQKKQELEAYNRAIKVDNASLANGRRMTNIGTFRAYVVAYLKNHPAINQEMTFLVRQLAPTECGLPIEIYVFSKDKRWANYEAIQADIFDHILSVVPEFDLRIFQNPAGSDFRQIRLQESTHG